MLTFTAAIFISFVDFPIRVHPLDNFHMIGYKRWNITLQNGSIPLNHILVIDTGLVKLANN